MYSALSISRSLLSTYPNMSFQGITFCCLSTAVMLSISLFLLPCVRGQESSTVPPDCNSANFSCSPSNYPGVGVCEDGQCYCNQTTLGDCFVLKNNSCQLNKCYEYMPEEGTCRKGTKSRTVAILLSFFLINFGAANFYIERFELAIPQIVLGLLLCFFQFGSCAVAATRDNSTSVACIVCCSINSLLSLLFVSWWIADLVIFLTNGRRSGGNNCPLFT